MATIVRHDRTKKTYVLIGTSYSYFKDSMPSFFGGALFPTEEEGLFNLASVTDESGVIKWLPIEELKVISVDGVPIRSILEKHKDQVDSDEAVNDQLANDEVCPGCKEVVAADARECPHCGLTLILEEMDVDNIRLSTTPLKDVCIEHDNKIKWEE